MEGGARRRMLLMAWRGALGPAERGERVIWRARVRGERGKRGGELCAGGADLRSGPDGDEGVADAAALEALTSRIEAQVEARMKKKIEDAFASPLHALQQDLANTAAAVSAKDEKINSLRAELEKQRWASKGFNFPSPSSRAESKMTKSFGEAMTEAAKIIGAAVSEAVEGGYDPSCRASQSKRLSFLGSTLFNSMKASAASELKGVPTAISVKEGLSSKPDISIKRDITNFYQACGAAKLMVDFQDSVSHAFFVDLLRMLVQRLAGLAYPQLEVADTEAASVTMFRHLLGDGRELDTAGILLLIDKQFVSPTQVERDRELALELAKIKTAMDILLDEWQAQFRIYGKQPGFAESFMPSQLGNGEEAAGGSSKPPKEPVRMMSGTDFMRKVASSLLGVAPGDLGEPKGKSEDDTKFLRRLIAAVTREHRRMSSGGWRLIGFLALLHHPNERREPLHIGKISAAVDIKLSPDIQKSVDGPLLCPCAHLNGVPAENWYYSPRSEEFKSGKPEFTRQPTAEVTKFGYYHKLVIRTAPRSEIGISRPPSQHTAVLRITKKPIGGVCRSGIDSSGGAAACAIGISRDATAHADRQLPMLH
ncbi:MAG: hypothetical protein SGPRY_001946 [Prymnesium sp.]